MKNLKHSNYFYSKFLAVRKFICQLFDISSYMILQKEFQLLKNISIIRENNAKINNKNKININDPSFDIDMKECLDLNKLSILGKLSNIQN